MVIGNGMIAKRFSAYDTKTDIIIFASGVSNSKNTDEEAYKREFNLLKDTYTANPGKKIVYFSTCSIQDPAEANAPYILHKLRIEEFIKQNVKHYLIFRVSNLVGSSDNKNTILNFFVYHIKHKINFDLWTNATRNLIDLDDMYAIANTILSDNLFENQIINIANEVSYAVTEIINPIETALDIKANYISIPKGIPFTIDISLIIPFLNKLNIRFGDNYLKNLINKYYKNI